MTETTGTLPYAGPHQGICPLCGKRPQWKKSIYNHPVCKKCYYKFANRRQLAYLVDAILIAIPNVPINYFARRYLESHGVQGIALQAFLVLVSALIFCLFIMKDGFNGQSPGKWLTDVVALDDDTGQPIGFGQSFKRNSVLLFGLIPFLGGIVSLVIVLIIAVQVARGYRLGDRFAHTRVIWKRYAFLRVFSSDSLSCEKCGYDLQGNVSGTCPECGTPVSEENLSRLKVN